MANWWEDAPLASDAGGGEWWKAAPLASEKKPASAEKPAAAEQSDLPAAISDIPKEIAKSASDNVDAIKKGLTPSGQGERGFLERSADLGKAIAGVPGLVLSPVTGAVRSVGGHLMADALHGVGEIINPEVAAKDDPQKMYETAKGDVDLAMAGARPGKGAAPAAAPKPPTEGQQVAAAADRVGVDLPRAVTSDSMVVQQAGKIASNVPGAGIPLRRASEKAIGQMGEAMTEARAGYGSSDAATAGQAIKEGVTDAIKTGPIKQKVDQLYTGVDNLVNPTVTGQLSNTQQVADAISARRTMSALPTSKNVAELDEALSRGGLTYDGVKGLRSYFGEMLNGGKEIPQGLSHSEVKQIYGALSKDLRLTIARAGGPDAISAYDKAEKAASRWANVREDLQRVLNVQSEEGIFARVLQAASSKSTADVKLLGRVRGAVGPDKWNEVASALIERLGRAPDGSFSPDRMLGPSGLGGLSDEGKRLIFRSTGKDSHADAIDDIATISKRWKSLKQFANPSGTGQTVIGSSIGTGAWIDPVTTATSFLSAYGISRVLAAPASAKAFASWANAYQKAVVAPSKAASASLEKASKVFAANAVKEIGGDVESLARKLQGPVPAGADQKDQSPGGVGNTEPDKG